MGTVAEVSLSPRLAAANAADLIAAGRLTPRHATVEQLTLAPGEKPFDLAFAVRVGVLDGRHPATLPATLPVALERLAEVLVPGGRLFVDGDDPLREVPLPGRA